MSDLSNKKSVGRKQEPGDTKPLMFRFVDDAEWQAVASMTPMQRTQACLLYTPEVLAEIIPILLKAGFRTESIFNPPDTT